MVDMGELEGHMERKLRILSSQHNCHRTIGSIVCDALNNGDKELILKAQIEIWPEYRMKNVFENPDIYLKYVCDLQTRYLDLRNERRQKQKYV